MLTCGFCASEIKNQYCAFCEMNLKEKHIMKDGERFDQTKRFWGYPDAAEIHRSTPELMQLETIELLCLLREARSFRAECYKLRLLRHQAEEQTGITESVQSIDEHSFNEYERATRKVWVIENIIKDRLGYFPQKVTKNFLNMYLERMEESEQKKMFIRKVINKKAR